VAARSNALIDTLKLARKLEDARFSREQPEAIAEAFADATTGTLASKADLELSTNTLRSELRARTDTLQAEIKTTADAARTEMKTTADALRAEMKTTADALRADMRALETTLREAMAAFHWRAIAGVAVMLLVHLMAVWGIVAANVP
jgi:seryl-tRNA synthetase